jgi:hypothetical protein
MISKLADRARVLAATPGEHLALPVAGRLVAAWTCTTLHSVRDHLRAADWTF